MKTSSMITARRWALSLFLVVYAFLSGGWAQDPAEFMPLHAWRFLGVKGGDDATSMLAEGFPGQRAEPAKDRWIEPADGYGGFDNVAPRLSPEEGPGGLEWNMSPT